MTILDVPQANCPIAAGGEDRVGIGPGRQAPDFLSVPEEDIPDCTAVKIGGPDDTMTAGPGDQPIVAREAAR